MVDPFSGFSLGSWHDYLPNWNLALRYEEIAFYHRFSDCPEEILADYRLSAIAKELVSSIKANLNIDWDSHENVKAKMRATVRRLLRRYGFTPPTTDALVPKIMEQAENLYRDWPSTPLAIAPLPKT